MQRQAEKAKIYKTKAEQLKEVEVALLVHDFMDYSDKLEKLNVEGQDYNLIKEELETKIRVYNEASEQKSKFVLELENNIKR